MQNRRTQENGVRTGISVDARPGVTPLSTGVIIYLEGLSVRHPKGARSIGIGHPRSGDRCADTRLDPLDPLRVAEQKSPFPAPPSGRRIPRASLIVRHPDGVEGLLATPDPRVFGAREWAPTRGASFPSLHDEMNSFCTNHMRCHSLCIL